MKIRTILIFTLLSLTLITYGCAQKGTGTSETKKEATPTPTESRSQQPQENVTGTLNDIESQIKEIEELEKSLQVINNMSFQI